MDHVHATRSGTGAVLECLTCRGTTAMQEWEFDLINEFLAAHASCKPIVATGAAAAGAEAGSQENSKPSLH